MVVETNEIRDSDDPRTPGAILVPVEFGRKEGEGQAPADDKQKREEKAEGDKGRGGSKASKPSGSETHAKAAEHQPAGHIPPAKVPSTARTLMLSGLVALVCGVTGAWGYMHFFGASKADDKQSTNKGSNSDGNSKKDVGSKSDNAFGGKGDTGDDARSLASGKEGTQGQTDSMSTANLAERVDRLTEQMEKLAMPRDATSPDVRTLQTKVGRLERSLGQVAEMPERLDRIDERLDDLAGRLPASPGQSTPKVGSGLPSAPDVPRAKPPTVPPSIPGSQALAGDREPSRTVTRP